MPAATPPAASDPWYKWVHGDELHQGDILPDCKVYTQRYPGRDEDGSISLIEGTNDLIVMSQSCDIVKRKGPEGEARALVALCRLLPLSEAQQGNPILRTRYGLEYCRRGLMTRSILLPPPESGEWGTSEPHVISFGELWTQPLGYVRDRATRLANRPRLRPPYREWVSQAFGRFFSRVGLDSELSEVDIESDENEIVARISALPPESHPAVLDFLKRDFPD